MFGFLLNKVAKLTRVEVFKKLNHERVYQQGKWKPDAGGVCMVALSPKEQVVAERYHEIGAWIGYMSSYLREAQDLDAHGDNHEEVLAKIRCVTAMGVACLEQHGCPDREEKPACKDAESNKTCRPTLEVLPPGVKAFLSTLIPDCKVKDCPIHGS